MLFWVYVLFIERKVHEKEYHVFHDNVWMKDTAYSTQFGNTAIHSTNKSDVRYHPYMVYLFACLKHVQMCALSRVCVCVQTLSWG